MPADPVAAFLRALDVTPLPSSDRYDRFEAGSLPMTRDRLFGGQVLAQAIVAASRTVDDDRLIHSMHGYFLRPGDAQSPLELEVDRIHDGRSFGTRRTQAYQGGVPILSMIASFQTRSPGLDHQVEMPQDVPDPDTLPTSEQVLEGIDHPTARLWATGRPFDVRHVEEPLYLRAGAQRVAHQAVWVRTRSALPDEPVLHRAALAFVSDYTVLEPVLRRHGIGWSTPGLSIASLDHAMWWHRPARADDWLLYTQESPTAIGGRGLAQGRFFDRDGQLVATVAQEGMVRIPADTPGVHVADAIDRTL